MAAPRPGGSLPPRPATQERLSRSARKLHCKWCLFFQQTICWSLLLTTPSGRIRWLCMKSLLSHLVPHWHLKGTLLAAEDTGKLQALASWLSPFFLPFFFSSYLGRPLCFYQPWKSSRIDLLGAVGSQNAGGGGDVGGGPSVDRGGFVRASEDRRSGLVAGIRALSPHVP